MLSTLCSPAKLAQRRLNPGKLGIGRVSDLREYGLVFPESKYRVIDIAHFVLT